MVAWADNDNLLPNKRVGLLWETEIQNSQFCGLHSIIPKYHPQCCIEKLSALTFSRLNSSTCDRRFCYLSANHVVKNGFFSQVQNWKGPAQWYNFETGANLCLSPVLTFHIFQFLITAFRITSWHRDYHLLHRKHHNGIHFPHYCYLRSMVQEEAGSQARGPCLSAVGSIFRILARTVRAKNLSIDSMVLFIPP